MNYTSVYWIRHKDHTDMFSQGYIGVSGRFDRRIWEHSHLKGNRHLKFAINKYGWDNLIKEQILIAERDYCLDIEKKLRPNDDIGWNCALGGGDPPVNKWNLGTKGVVKAWNKGLAWPEEFKQKVSIGVAKLWKDPEYKKRMSEAHKGKPSPRKGTKHSPETIERMRLSKLGKESGMKGKKHSPETIAKVKAQNLANQWTCPHCSKQGRNKGTGTRWHFDNCKKKELL
jgi:predicted GIY-YIG superfamily endonuclease